MTRPATLSRQRTLRASLSFILLLSFIAIAAPLLAPYSPVTQEDIVRDKSQSPSLSHPFGTDLSGRDVLSRVIYGARVSLSVAAASVAVALVIGTAFGAIAALAGGAVDRIMMRLLDVLLSIPRLVVLLAAAAAWNGVGLDALIVLLGCTGWYTVARLVRSETNALLGRDFVLAAKAGGIGRARLLRRHLFPHLLPVLAVSATLGIANTITLEAALSYVGFGVQPPTPSWGSIMQDSAGLGYTQWWLIVFPGMAIILAVLACNALGDALRDAFTTEQVHG